MSRKCLGQNTRSPTATYCNQDKRNLPAGIFICSSTTLTPPLSCRKFDFCVSWSEFSATAMAVPPPPLQSLTSEQKLTLQERMECVLIQLMQMNSHTIFFREAPLFSAFRDRLGYNGSSNSKAGDPNPLEPGRDFVQCFRETIPLTLYDAYEPFVSRFFKNSPRSSSVRDLLSPGFPEFIAQTSGTSGSTVKSFPRYPTENGHYFPKGIRFCAFSSLRVSGAVKIVNEDGDLQRELPVTTIGSGMMRRHMGVELKDEDKIMSQTRSFFCEAISCRVDH